jgi:hypothetical protein
MFYVKALSDALIRRFESRVGDSWLQLLQRRKAVQGSEAEAVDLMDADESKSKRLAMKIVAPAWMPLSLDISQFIIRQQYGAASVACWHPTCNDQPQLPCRSMTHRCVNVS